MHQYIGQAPKNLSEFNCIEWICVHHENGTCPQFTGINFLEGDIIRSNALLANITKEKKRISTSLTPKKHIV